MFLNYKIKKKTEKVGFYIKNGRVNQPNNSELKISEAK